MEALTDEEIEVLVAAIAALPGIKRKHIKNCALCDKGVAHDGNMTFYRLKIERFMLSPRGIQQTAGLEQFFGGGGGGAMLADVMGSDPDLAKAVILPVEVLICEDCATRACLIHNVLED